MYTSNPVSDSRETRATLSTYIKPQRGAKGAQRKSAAAAVTGRHVPGPLHSTSPGRRTHNSRNAAANAVAVVGTLDTKS